MLRFCLDLVCVPSFPGLALVASTFGLLDSPLEVLDTPSPAPVLSVEAEAFCLLFGCTDVLKIETIVKFEGIFLNKC